MGLPGTARDWRIKAMSVLHLRPDVAGEAIEVVVMTATPREGRRLRVPEKANRLSARFMAWRHPPSARLDHDHLRESDSAHQGERASSSEDHQAPSPPSRWVRRARQPSIVAASPKLDIDPLATADNRASAIDAIDGPAPVVSWSDEVALNLRTTEAARSRAAAARRRAPRLRALRRSPTSSVAWRSSRRQRTQPRCRWPSFERRSTRRILSSRSLAEKMLADLPAENAFAAAVRRAVAEFLPSGDVTLSRTARRLALGERTVQRRLREAGLSFQSLVDAVRRDASHRFMRDRRLSVEEVAYLLGFSDPRSFRRARHRWNALPDVSRSVLASSPPVRVRAVRTP